MAKKYFLEPIITIDVIVDLSSKLVMQVRGNLVLIIVIIINKSLTCFRLLRGGEKE